MTDLSLRQYLQNKKAGGAHGIRWCAPDLKTLSMRSVLHGIDRRIIHLTDLHIGLNHSSIPKIQLQSIVDSIIRTYPPEQDSYESPRPLIVITGDLVDHYTSNNLDTLRDLLDQLAQHGFTVLVVPGNHDYSESFSTDSFTPLESLPGIGDAIKVITAQIEDHIGRGQDRQLVSGMTLDPAALVAFQAKLSSYLRGGSYVEGWKAKGAVHDLDFILLDGQDRQSRRPDWDDPKQFVRRQVRKAVVDFSVGSLAFLADRIADAVSNLALDPATIGAAAAGTVIGIEASVLVPDFGLAAVVGSVAAKWAAQPPLDARFFLHDGDFRLAHGFLDAPQQRTLQARVADDGISDALPIVCIHYWLNYPKMDRRYNINGPGAHPDNTLVNESPALFAALDRCHLLMVGHIHQDQYGASHTFQASSTKQDMLRYYSRAGSTIPDPVDWRDDSKMRDHQKWLELTVNLNSGEIAEPWIVHVDGRRTPLS